MPWRDPGTHLRRLRASPAPRAGRSDRGAADTGRSQHHQGPFHSADLLEFCLHLFRGGAGLREVPTGSNLGLQAPVSEVYSPEFPTGGITLSPLKATVTS
jgi:hypothetical protein